MGETADDRNVREANPRIAAMLETPTAPTVVYPDLSPIVAALAVDSAAGGGPAPAFAVLMTLQPSTW